MMQSYIQMYQANQKKKLRPEIDDFLAIYMFVLMKSQVYEIHSHLRIIELFLPEFTFSEIEKLRIDVQNAAYLLIE